MLTEIRDGERTYWVNSDSQTYYLLEANRGPVRRIKRRAKKLIKNNGTFLVGVMLSILFVLVLAGILVLLLPRARTSPELHRNQATVPEQKGNLEILNSTPGPSTPAYVFETATAGSSTLAPAQYTETPTEIKASPTEVPSSTVAATGSPTKSAMRYVTKRIHFGFEVILHPHRKHNVTAGNN